MFAAAKAQGYQSVQFTEHYDCLCGTQGYGSWKEQRGLCQTEIVDVAGNGHNACASSYKTGFAATKACECDNSVKYANCKGYGFQGR